MQLYKKRKGFTLLELMIVVIIIGILASLAIPRFIDAMEKARRGAAASMLASIRSAQMRHYLEHDAYTTNMADLDVSLSPSTDWTINDPTAAALGSVTHNDTNTTYTISEDGTISP